MSAAWLLSCWKRKGWEYRMKPNLLLVGALVTAVACTALEVMAMPTREEVRMAMPSVQKVLASEQEALQAGKKTRSEVADAAMKLAAQADTDAAKLLLMKGAFVLYVRDDNLVKAVETMTALKTAISDIPVQSISNMVETAVLGTPRKDGDRLYQLIGEAKERTRAQERKNTAVDSTVGDDAGESILDRLGRRN